MSKQPPERALHKSPPQFASWQPVPPLKREIISVWLCSSRGTNLPAGGSSSCLWDSLKRMLCWYKNMCFRKRMGGVGGWCCVKWAPPLHCSWGGSSCSSYSHLDCPSTTSGSYHPQHKHRHASTQRNTFTNWKPPPVLDTSAFLAHCALAVTKQRFKRFLPKQKVHWMETC